MNIYVQMTDRAAVIEAELYETQTTGPALLVAEIPPIDVPLSPSLPDDLQRLLDAAAFWCRLQGKQPEGNVDVLLF
jgi:hypothetical protein